MFKVCMVRAISHTPVLVRTQRIFPRPSHISTTPIIPVGSAVPSVYCSAFNCYIVKLLLYTENSYVCGVYVWTRGQPICSLSTSTMCQSHTTVNVQRTVKSIWASCGVDTLRELNLLRHNEYSNFHLWWREWFLPLLEGKPPDFKTMTNTLRGICQNEWRQWLLRNFLQWLHVPHGSPLLNIKLNKVLISWLTYIYRCTPHRNVPYSDVLLLTTNATTSFFTYRK